MQRPRALGLLAIDSVRLFSGHWPQVPDARARLSSQCFAHRVHPFHPHPHHHSYLYPQLKELTSFCCIPLPYGGRQKTAAHQCLFQLPSHQACATVLKESACQVSTCALLANPQNGWHVSERRVEHVQVSSKWDSPRHQFHRHRAPVSRMQPVSNQAMRA